MAAPDTSTGRARPTTSTIVALVLGAILVLFAALNSQSVTIHWIFTSTSSPLILVIAVCGLVGFAAGWLLARRSAKRAAPR